MFCAPRSGGINGAQQSRDHARDNPGPGEGEPGGDQEPGPGHGAPHDLPEGEHLERGQDQQQAELAVRVEDRDQSEGHQQDKAPEEEHEDALEKAERVADGECGLSEEAVAARCPPLVRRLRCPGRRRRVTGVSGRCHVDRPCEVEQGGAEEAAQHGREPDGHDPGNERDDPEDHLQAVHGGAGDGQVPQDPPGRAAMSSPGPPP